MTNDISIRKIPYAVSVMPKYKKRGWAMYHSPPSLYLYDVTKTLLAYFVVTGGSSGAPAMGVVLLNGLFDAEAGRVVTRV